MISSSEKMAPAFLEMRTSWLMLKKAKRGASWAAAGAARAADRQRAATDGASRRMGNLQGERAIVAWNGAPRRNQKVVPMENWKSFRPSVSKGYGFSFRDQISRRGAGLMGRKNRNSTPAERSRVGFV